MSELTQSPSEPVPDDKLQKRTYMMTVGINRRLQELARREGVGVNELARFLMDDALRRAESRALPIPTEPLHGRIRERRVIYDADSEI